MFRINVTHIKVIDNTAFIAIGYQGWMKYLFWVYSIGSLICAGFFFYAQAPIVGSVLVLAGLFLFTISTYRIETIIDKSNGSVVHKTFILGIKFQNQVLLSESSILAKIYSNSKGRYTIVYLVSKDRKFKIGEILNPDIDAVNDTILDKFISTIQEFCELSYEKAF